MSASPEASLSSEDNSSVEIVTMALSMFIVTFFVGCLPSKLQTSTKVMNLISLFGAGLLVGAALIVIVPEGMSVLYESMKESTVSNKTEVLNRYVGASLIFGFIVMLLIDHGFQALTEGT